MTAGSERERDSKFARLIADADLRDQAADRRDARAQERDLAALGREDDGAVAADREQDVIDRLWAARDRDAALTDRVALSDSEDDGPGPAD